MISSSTFDKINNLVYNNSNLLEENQKKEQIEHAIDFISFYEEKKEETILFSNNEFMQHFITRDAVVNAFEIMKLFYLDSLKFITNTKIEIFDDYQEQILLVSRKNTVLSSIRKIKKIIKYIEKIKYNVNINLLIDRFIIELGDELDD
jgi:hypothetical protein